MSDTLVAVPFRADDNFTGGWIRDAVPYSIPSSQFEQIDQAFLNIQTALADGGATFDHVFKVVSLHTELNDEVNGYMTKKFREYMPIHKPLWTTMGVTKLGEAQMKVEIEVIAHVPAK